jgi:hypothetical protein
MSGGGRKGLDDGCSATGVKMNAEELAQAFIGHEASTLHRRWWVEEPESGHAQVPGATPRSNQLS